VRETLINDERFMCKLLEPPSKLPVTTQELTEFLSKRTGMLPVCSEGTLKLVHDANLT
jgi:hypothetical protein